MKIDRIGLNAQSILCESLRCHHTGRSIKSHYECGDEWFFLDRKLTVVDACLCLILFLIHINIDYDSTGRQWRHDHRYVICDTLIPYACIVEMISLLVSPIHCVNCTQTIDKPLFEWHLQKKIINSSLNNFFILLSRIQVPPDTR